MAGPQTVWGIDVGKCALKAVKLRIGADKSAEIVAADYIEHGTIMNQQDADVDALWASTLEKFLSRNDISNDKVVVSVAGQQTLARFTKLPPVEKKKVPDIVRYEADQQIPFDMDEVVWDYQVFQAPDSPDVEVGIFAIKRNLIRDHLIHFEAGGIEAMAVQSSPLSLYNAAHYDEVIGDDTVVLLDIGTESTDLLVATKDSLWTRTFDLGGNSFTEALVKSFKLSFSKAEALKRSAASSKYARQVFQAMRPVFADLVQELQRSLGFYTATHRDADLSKVVGIGSAFKLPGLQKYIKQNLQMDVDILEKFSKISIPKTAEGDSDHAGSFAIAYGLALQGLSLSAVDSNLLPPEIAKQVVWRKKRPFFAAAAACLLLTSGVIWFRQMTDKGTMEAAQGNPNVKVPYEQAENILKNPPPIADEKPLEYGKTILEAANALKKKHGELSSQGNNELKKIETITNLLENKALWLKIINAIHAALPQPPGELAAAQNAREYLAALEKSDQPRSDREEIFIENFTSKYVLDVDAEDLIEDAWDQANVNVIEKTGNTPRPGFIVTLICRTPRDPVFLTNDFFKKLRDEGRKENQGFYINRIGLVSISEGTSTGGGNDSDNSGRGRRGGRSGRGGRGSTGASSTSQKTGEIDPLTNEPVNDGKFKVTMNIVLEDLPKPKDQKKDN